MANNIYKHTKLLLGGAAVAVGLTAAAGVQIHTTVGSGIATADTIPTDTIMPLDDSEPRWLPGEIKDTVEAYAQWEAQQRNDFRSNINVLYRTYGDSIVLRWAPDDYATWKYLCRTGINIVRIDVDDARQATLVKRMLPSTLEEFRSVYGVTDSLALIAMASLYNKNTLRPDQTQMPAGELGSLLEISQDQQMTFGMGVLVSELRPDLADRLQMRFVDANVKKGKRYEYCIVPSEIDSTGHVAVNAGNTGIVENVAYKPVPFDVEIGDSITSQRGIRLGWTRRNYSAYEIERRVKGTTQWKRLNENPYMVLVPEQEDMDCFFFDENLTPATYEYRILAHDPFGELTAPSAVHTVVMPDLVGPQAPQITWINIDRPVEDDPAAEVWADIHFEKDSIEDDMKGIDVLYYHEVDTVGQWTSLLDGRLLPPTDTVCRVDVTNISSSQVAVAAVDTAGNYTYSIPQLMRVSDMRAPDAPTGLKAVTSLADGTITLTWNRPAAADINYYEVAFANDTTHTFLLLNEGKLRDTTYVDTVALDVNQKFIYYKVRAVDYATNMGEYSDILQVVRPSAVPPSVAHLDSSYVDGKGVYMRWVAGNDAQMAYHHVYRRLVESEDKWTLIRRCDADSVKQTGDIIELLDHPKENSYEEYAYAVESFNYSDVSSGLSLQFVTRFTGDPVFSLPIKLLGDYDARNKMTKLAWELDKAPEGSDWYFCIWRKGPKDDRFKFLISADPDENSFTDYLLSEGETAEYYIQIQMEDGRESEQSNIVTIKAPINK